MVDITELILHRPRAKSTLSAFFNTTEKHHIVKKDKIERVTSPNRKNEIPAKGTSSSLIHYGFEKHELNNVADDSGNNINAILMNGARVTKHDAKCGAALDLNGGELVIRGQTLASRGIDSITIAMWVKVHSEKRDFSLFNIDSKASDGSGAAIALEIKDGRMHWSHVDESGDVVFNLFTVQQSTMPIGLWSHIAATYDSTKGLARLYIDSQFINEVQGNGKMSSQFKGKVSVGKGGTLPGLIDEFHFFQKSLSFNDVKDLSGLCDVDGDYPIPMENGAAAQETVSLPRHIEHLKTDVAHRHSNVETLEKNEDDDTLVCKKQMALRNTDLRGGETSGVFTDFGDVSSLDECVDKCCLAKDCHIAYMKKRRCFTVVCHFPSLCQPVKVGRSLVHVAFVLRNGESVYIKDETPTQLDTSTDSDTKPRPSKSSLTTQTPSTHRCLQTSIYYGVALKGGWTAGKFTDRGIVPSMTSCVNKCCDDKECDMVMLLSQKCFTIHCYNLDDCQTIPNGHAHIAYVTREAFSLVAPTQDLPHDRMPSSQQSMEMQTAPARTMNNAPTRSVPISEKYPTMSGKRSDMVLHYTFEKLDEDFVIDESGFNNNGKLMDGASLSPDGGVRGNGVSFFGGAIMLDKSFRNKPKKAITVALWVKLNDIAGRNTLFSTIGRSHDDGFRLVVIDGRIKWALLVSGRDNIFALQSGAIVTKNKWFQITVTADVEIGEAKIYVNGGVQSIGVAHGSLATDWSVNAGFGVHEGGRPLHCLMDDIYVYTSALYKDEIIRYIRKFDEMRFMMTPSPVTVAWTRRPPTRKNTARIQTFIPKRSTTFSTTTATTTTTITTTSTSTTTPSTTPPTTTVKVTVKSATKPLVVQKEMCKFGNVYEYTDLKGGLGAGNFLDRGITSNIQTCMELCCSHKTCDLAYVVSARCYLVECYTEDLCAIVPKSEGSLSPIIGMVVRPNSPKIPQLGDNIVLPPTRPWTTNKQGVTPDSLKNMDDLEHALEPNLKFKHLNKQCKFKKTLTQATFVGGLKAGNFTNKGTVTSMGVCKTLCCRHERCDVAVMMRNGCFLMTCHSKDLCKPRKSHLDTFNLKLAYRDFKAEKESEESDDDEDDDDDSAGSVAKPSKLTTHKNAPVTNKTPSPTIPTPVSGRLSKPISNTIPPVLLPQKGVTSWCSPSFILTGVELNGGLKSGPSKDLGKVATIQECVQKCCMVPDCTVAYTEDLTCYAVLCLNKNICQAKMSTTPSKSVGYVIRNGWSLFMSEQKALKGAAFLSTDKPEPVQELNTTIASPLTTKTTTTSTMIPTTTSTATTTTTATTTITTTTTTQAPNNISIDVSALLPETKLLNASSKETECRSNGTIRDHRFVSGMRAGIFTDHGEVGDANDIESCVKYCCLDKLCDVAYMVGRHCYTMQCYSIQTCRIFATPNFILNPVMAFIVRKTTPKVDVISLEYIPNNNNTALSTTQSVTNSSRKAHTVLHTKFKKKTMENTDRPSSKTDEFMKEDISGGSGSGEGSGLDSQGHTRGHVPNILEEFEEIQDRKNTTNDRYYFPLGDVDINVIQSLSPDKEFTECNSKQYECDHFCINLLHGGPRCMCRNGYQLALDGKHCLYQGECNAVAHGCDQACRFVTDGFVCQCRSGFIMTKRSYKDTCEDMDECSMGIHGCSHDCINTKGSYICQCPDGYQLASDRLNCESIGSPWKKDQILRGVEGPKINQSLTIPARITNHNNTIEVTQGETVLLTCETQGTPEPITVWTYGENYTTIPIGYDRFKMLPGGDLIIDGTQIQDTGKYTCISGNIGGTDTATGYLTVNDIDECVTGKHNCSHICTNTFGGFECSCYQGYVLLSDRSSCQDFNECDISNDCDHYCWNTIGSYACSCRDGYQLSQQKFCQDIDECALGLHQCSQNCTNTQGGYICGCHPGYNLSSSDNSTCLPYHVMNETDHHVNHTRFFIHPHVRHHGKSMKRTMYLITTVILVVTLFLVSIALILIWRNYKKRWTLQEEACGFNAPPIKSRCSAMFSWN